MPVDARILAAAEQPQESSRQRKDDRIYTGILSPRDMKTVTGAVAVGLLAEAIKQGVFAAPRSTQWMQELTENAAGGSIGLRSAFSVLAAYVVAQAAKTQGARDKLCAPALREQLDAAVAAMAAEADEAFGQEA